MLEGAQTAAQAASHHVCKHFYGYHYIGKFIDRGGHLLKLRLQINEAACHFCCPSYCHFQSFAAVGIPVGRRSYAVNDNCPSPHAVFLCREYLDFPSFVSKARHGIQRLALAKRLRPIYQARAQANVEMRQKARQPHQALP
jgi:hypothetical protein